MVNLAIRVCTPTPAHRDWGDTPFGERLAAAFRDQNCGAAVFCRSEWGEISSSFDVVLTLVGQETPNPHLGARNLVWVISHPELRSPAELNAYDRVFVASELFCDLIRADLRTAPVFLPQCGDDALFTPDPDAVEDIDLLFVGNNYYQDHPRRLIVEDVLKAGLIDRLRVVGRNWERGAPPTCILGEHIPYEEAAALYRRARICLNDHHPYMRRFGFINNRTYDLALLGKCQVSDEVTGIDRLGVATYHTPVELRALIEGFLGDPADRLRRGLISRRLCVDSTFRNRAGRFLQSL
jgi:O-antigen biosynthesis protein